MYSSIFCKLEILWDILELRSTVFYSGSYLVFFKENYGHQEVESTIVTTFSDLTSLQKLQDQRQIILIAAMGKADFICDPPFREYALPA